MKDLNWKDLEVTFEINGVETVVAYIETIDKYDYIYNLKKELVAEVYNNDYEVVKILSKLTEKIEKEIK